MFRSKRLNLTASRAVFYWWLPAGQALPGARCYSVSKLFVVNSNLALPQFLQPLNIVLEKQVDKK